MVEGSEEKYRNYVKKSEKVEDMAMGQVFNSDMDDIHSPSLKFDGDWHCDCKAGVYQQGPCRHIKGLLYSMPKKELIEIILRGIS